MSVVNCVIRISDIGSIAAAKIFTNVVMPRGMYGDELWYSFGNGQLHALEVANRFCLKHLQSISKSSKSMLVEGMIGSYSAMSAEHSIDGWMNQAYSRLSTTHGHITDCKLVCVYLTRLVLVRPAASLYSASPLKHHSTGKQ